MKTLIATTAAVAALSLAAPTDAARSTQSEARGLAKCVAAVDAESNGLVTSRHYFLDKTQDQNHYYVNASRWEDGERQAVRISCQTDSSGRMLLTTKVEEGRYTNRRPTMTIAGQ